MLPRIKITLLISFFLFLGNSSVAQWKQIDYNGGYVFSVLQIDQTAFAQTEGGIYKSVDFGNNWTETNSDTILKLFNVYSFSAMGSYPKLFSANNMLFYGYENILLKSSDLGITWSKYALSPALKFIDYFEIGDTLFAYTGSDDQKIYKIVGNDWVLQSQSTNYHYFFQVDNSSFYNYNFYSPNQGLYSTPDGKNFTKITLNGIPKNDSVYTSGEYHYFYDISGFGGNGNYLFAIVNGNTIYSSYLFGNWNQSFSGLPNNITSISEISLNNNSVFVRFDTNNADNVIYRSDDFGLHWNLSDSNAYLPNIKFRDRLIRGSVNGIYVSDDNGISWNSSSAGLKSSYIYFTKSYKNCVYAFDYGLGRLVRSIDNGLNWNIPFGLDIGFQMSPYNFNFSDSISFINHYKGVYKTTDSGNSWINVFYPTSIGEVSWIKILDNNYVYLCGVDSLNDKRYYRTKDFLTYENLNYLFPVLPALVNDMVLVNNKLYAYTHIPTKVYSSIDNGFTWNLDVAGLPTSARFKVNNFNVIGDKLILSMYDELYAVSPRLYLKDGNDWVRKACNGLPNNLFAIDIIEHKNILYSANFFTKNVYYSLDFGENWTIIDTIGLTNSVSITVDALSVTDAGIFIGTHNSGLWKYSMLPSGINTQTKSLIKVQIFPNPSMEFIDFSSDRKIEYYNILDISGVMVQHGKYDNQKISIKNLPSGIYIVKFLLNNNQFRAEKFVKY